MKTDHTKLLETIAASGLAARLTQDAESERLAKRREAIEALRAVRARAPLVEKAAAALEAEIAAARQGYADAEAALGAAAGKLWGAQRRLDETWNEHQRSEGSARGAVHTVSNPRRQDLLLTPLREAIEATHATKPMVETDFDPTRPGRVVKSHKATLPAIMARRAFFERAGNLAQEHLLAVDDDDAELFRIRELIFAHAPSAERLVPIALDKDGARRAQEQEIARAIEAAETLAKSGFGVDAPAAAEEPRASIVPLKRAAGK